MTEAKTKVIDIKALNDAICDVEATLPIIKSLINSVNETIDNSMIDDALSIMNSIFETLFYISQLIEIIESELSSNIDLKEIIIDNKRACEVEKSWIDKLTELKEAASNFDIIKACDIIKYDFPNEIEYQVKLLKKLIEIKKEKDGITN